ncbi:biotin/lipoyl-containing protein, partial [Xanthomonas citri pv. citri]
MSDNKNFHLPDLGEGLPDATIVEWFVKEGDTVRLDDPLVSMETAKAVVEVPSPFSGTVVKLAGAAGDVIVTGSVLAQFALDASQPQRADGQDTGHSHGPAPTHSPTPSTGDSAAGPTARVVASDNGGEIADADAGDEGSGDRDDAGTVVGAMQSSNAVQSEQAIAVGGVRAMPVVRALARKLRVELAQVRATGPDGTVTLADVKQAAAAGTAQPSPGVQGAPSSPANGKRGLIGDGGRAAGIAADG